MAGLNTVTKRSVVAKLIILEVAAAPQGQVADLDGAGNLIVTFIVHGTGFGTLAFYADPIISAVFVFILRRLGAPKILIAKIRAGAWIAVIAVHRLSGTTSTFTSITGGTEQSVIARPIGVLVSATLSLVAGVGRADVRIVAQGIDRRVGTGINILVTQVGGAIHPVRAIHPLPANTSDERQAAFLTVAEQTVIALPVIGDKLATIDLDIAGLNGTEYTIRTIRISLASGPAHAFDAVTRQGSCNLAFFTADQIDVGAAIHRVTHINGAGVVILTCLFYRPQTGTILTNVTCGARVAIIAAPRPVLDLAALLLVAMGDFAGKFGATVSSVVYKIASLVVVAEILGAGIRIVAGDGLSLTGSAAANVILSTEIVIITGQGVVFTFTTGNRTNIV